MKNNILHIIIVVLVISLTASITRCSQNANGIDSTTNALTAKVKYYKNKLGTETASKIVFETSNRNLKQLVLKKDDSLRKLTDEFAKVKSIVVVKTEIKIDSIPVPFEVPIPCDFERKGSYLTKNFNFDWEIDPNGLDFKNIRIPNETTVISGFKKKWFLGRRTMTTDVTNSNPLITTTDVKTIEVKITKPFYDTRVFNVAVGLIGGYLLK